MFNKSFQSNSSAKILESQDAKKSNSQFTRTFCSKDFCVKLILYEHFYHSNSKLIVELQLRHLRPEK